MHIISETIHSSDSCQFEECKVFKKDLLAGTGCQIPTSPHKQVVAQLPPYASEYRFSKLCLLRIPKNCPCITEVKAIFFCYWSSNFSRKPFCSGEEVELTVPYCKWYPGINYLFWGTGHQMRTDGFQPRRSCQTILTFPAWIRGDLLTCLALTPFPQPPDLTTSPLHHHDPLVKPRFLPLLLRILRPRSDHWEVT